MPLAPHLPNDAFPFADCRWQERRLMTGEELLSILAADMARVVSEQYRMDRVAAARRILEIWAANSTLQTAASVAGEPQKLARMRVYKDAARDAKATIYSELRRYRADDTALTGAIAELEAIEPGCNPDAVAAIVRRIAANHASTAERLPHLDQFLAELLAFTGQAKTVLDAGAGMMPILFPFEKAPALVSYVACDRDRIAMRALEAYARWRGDGRLIVLNWSLADGWAAVIAAGGVEKFDVALMLKFVPVVRRQEPESLRVLAQVPAGRMMVGGSRVALVKRLDIERRERGVVDKFVREAGWHAVGTFRTPDEFAVIATRADINDP
jgi:16S rRNA (guanine(1405)-N(7))-methyltransferase